MGIKGQIRFSVNGLNIEKLINKLHLNGITLYGVTRRQHKKLSFAVSAGDGKKVIACLDNLCYNYKLTEEKGILPLIKLLIKRAGLIAGGLVFAAAVTASAFFTYEIRISGCKTIDPLLVKNSLKEAGAAEKSFYRADSQIIERTVYSSFPSAAFVSAYYKGVVLYVNIVETENAPKVIDLTPCDLTAANKGKISRLIVFQGTPLVKAGDTVEKGQVIIGGYRESPSGEHIPVRAMGEAYGIVELQYTEKFLTEQTVKCRSGRTSTASHIEIFGMVFPQKKPQAEYTSYETETASDFIFKNNILPARLITVTYYETVTVTVTQDFEKAKKLIIEEAEKSAVTKAKTEGNVTQILTTVKDEGKIKYITSKVLVEKSFFTK